MAMVPTETAKGRDVYDFEEWEGPLVILRGFVDDRMRACVS